MADLLEHHWVFDGPGDLAKPIDRAGEVGVALVLHGLLQRIGMHRKRIRADAIKGVDQLGHQLVGELRQSDVADQQRIRRDIAHREARRRDLVAQHDALRAEHHADAELLGGGGQVAVDDTGELGAARHRPDQHRRLESDAQKVGVGVDGAQIGLGQRVVGQRDALQSCRHGLVVHRFGQAHIDVPCLAGLHAVTCVGCMLTVYPHWDNGTVSEGLWIAIAVIAVLVVAAVVVFGLVRSRRGKISLDSSTSTDTATPVDKSGGYTASSGISFTQSSASAPAPPPTEAPPERIDTSGLPAVGDDATIPRDAPKRPIADVPAARAGHRTSRSRPGRHSAD